MRSIKKIIPSQKVNMGGIVLDQPLPFRGQEQIDPFLLVHLIEGENSLLRVGILNIIIFYYVPNLFYVHLEILYGRTDSSKLFYAALFQ